MVASFGGGDIDPTRTTRVLLVGDSDKLGPLPLYAAITRAHRYAELRADDQIVLFITKDVSEDKLAETGAELISDGAVGDVAVSDLQALDATTLVDALDHFERIASIDFFGHSSPFGALLEKTGYDHTLAATSPADLGKLADNFARERDPYVTLNGCNGGAETAPALSALLGLPVSGALTGTMFQTVMTDGRWYYDDPAFYPPTKKHASKNKISFSAKPSPSCATGRCTRMKPQDSPYRGVWADPATGFQYGLDHYKFFCDYDDDKNSCLRGMAQALYAWPSVHPIDESSPEEIVKDVLVDYFCATNVDPTWFGKCSAGLRAAADAHMGFSTMKSSNDYAHECDLHGCEQELRCALVDGAPQYKSCAWVAKGCPDDEPASSPLCKVKNTSKMTTVNEWHRFLQGHALSQGD